MKIVVWRGVIIDYLFISPFLDGFEVFFMANADELKRYWNRPDGTMDKTGDVQEVPKD